MIDVFPFAGITVAVLGLGKSGMVAARALKESGAEVWAWDDSVAATFFGLSRSVARSPCGLGRSACG